MLIGLGQIGMGYDYYDSTEGFVVTHAKALHLHPDFELVGGVDTVSERREMFSEKYGKPSYETVKDALEICNPELAIVATPTREHTSTFRQILKCSSLRLLLCEKPLAETLVEAERMIETSKRRNVSVAVNYIRRYDSGIQSLLGRIKSGELGFPLKICVWYRKGIFNNGSHILNLLTSVLGKIQKVQIISRGGLWDGWDPEPDLRLEFERGEAFYLAGQEKDFSYNQVEIIGPRGKVLYDKDGKIYWWGTEKDKTFLNYTILRETAEGIPTNMKRSQYNVLQNISDFLSGNSKLLCDSKSGLLTMQILNKIQEKLK